jgi:hypothetical protein
LSRRALLIFVGVAAGILAATLVAGFAVLGADEGGDRAPAVGRVDLTPCRGLDDDATRECYTERFLALVDGRDDPRPAVEAISKVAWKEGGFLLSNCHGAMHAVGRAYARDAEVTLATLMDYLPQANDPGCSAGFAHGLVTGVAPQIDPSKPREAAAVCADADTRFQRYSCVHGFGHAFMRLYDDQLRPALGLCDALGPDAAPDCAQGAFHDYWFAVVGADDAQLREKPITDPRTLCGAQEDEFVRPCWYRAYIDNRPEGFEVAAPEDLESLCDGLAGLQREACMTAASVIGPADPAAQLQLCAALEDPVDAGNCVHGTKVQNLLDAPIGTYLGLIERCEVFTGAARGECYRWLGKALAVLTDGRFAGDGCPKLPAADARRECEAGARRMDEALVTFS